MADDVDLSAGCPTAREAVMRQDGAFDANGVDVALWTTTIYFPLIMASEDYTLVLRTPGDLEAQLQDLYVAAREEGTVRIKTRIRSLLEPSDTLAIVCANRDRIGPDGRVIASAASTWTVVNGADGWRVRMIVFDHRDGDHSLTSRLTRRKGEI